MVNHEAQLTQDQIDQARGADLLALAGVSLRKVAGTAGGEYAGPCPLCGQGRDRFRVQPHGQGGARWYCRVCGDGKWHDAIDFVQRRHNLDFAGAVAMLTGGLSMTSAAPTSQAPTAAASSVSPTEAPGQLWQERGRAFCEEARARLWSEAGAQALAGLQARGLSDETIKAAGLGWNDHDRRDARAAWGLPDELGDNGKPKGVWLPRGVVIPWQVGGQLWRVNIRRPAEDLARDRERGVRDPSKYIGPAGFGNGLYNADALQPGCKAVLVEGEIDALTIAQHAGGLAVAVATGSTHGSRRARWLARLALADLVLVAYDADPPGQAAADYWLGALANARRWRPYWSDANQMAQDGADLRQWLAVGLAGGASGALVPSPAPAAPQDEGAALVVRAGQDLTQDGARQPDPGLADQVPTWGAKQRGARLPAADLLAGRRVHEDFERARSSVADLEAELDGLLSELGAAPGVGLEFTKPGHAARALWQRYCQLESQWRTLAPVAAYASFDELEAATGAAYQAHIASPADPALQDAYRRLDDCWAAVLELPEVTR